MSSVAARPNQVWLIGAIAGFATAGVNALWLIVGLATTEGFLTPLALIGTLAAIALGAAGGAMVFIGKPTLTPWLLLGAFIAQFIGWMSYGFTYAVPVVNLLQDIQLLTSYVSILNLLVVLSDLIYIFLLVVIILVFLPANRNESSQSLIATPPVEMGEMMSINESDPLASGWYPDPDGKPSERFWDGFAWTEQTRPMTTNSAPVQIVAAAKPTVTATGQPISDKSRAAAALLCWFLGVIGIHRFYVGKVGTGIAQIFTLGGLGIWALVDFIMILAGSFRDKDNRLLINW